MELKMKDMRAQHLGQNVTVEGEVTKTWTQYPFLQKAVFMCQRCGHIHLVKQDSFKLTEPLVCENETCGKKGPFKQLPEESVYIDAQEIEISDYTDDGYKYEDRRKAQLKVVLLGDAVGKTHLEERFIFAGKFGTSELGRKLEYILWAHTVETRIEREANRVFSASSCTLENDPLNKKRL